MKRVVLALTERTEAQSFWADFLRGKICPNCHLSSEKLLRILIFFFLLFLSALLTVPCHVGAVSKGISVVSCGGQSLYLYKDYYALVVGVSNYDKWPDLPNAVRDAREVSWFLKRLGFKVTLVTDPTSQELKRAMNTLARKTGQEPDRG